MAMINMKLEIEQAGTMDAAATMLYGG